LWGAGALNFGFWYKGFILNGFLQFSGTKATDLRVFSGTTAVDLGLNLKLQKHLYLPLRTAFERVPLVLWNKSSRVATESHTAETPAFAACRTAVYNLWRDGSLWIVWLDLNQEFPENVSPRITLQVAITHPNPVSLVDRGRNAVPAK